MKRIIDGHILHDGKVEIQTIHPDARFEFRVGLIQVHGQRRVHVFRRIPCHDRRIVLLVRAALQHYADSLIGKNRPVRVFRGKIGRFAFALRV